MVSTQSLVHAVLQVQRPHLAVGVQELPGDGVVLAVGHHVGYVMEGEPMVTGHGEVRGGLVVVEHRALGGVRLRPYQLDPAGGGVVNVGDAPGVSRREAAGVGHRVHDRVVAAAVGGESDMDEATHVRYGPLDAERLPRDQHLAPVGVEQVDLVDGCPDARRNGNDRDQH